MLRDNMEDGFSPGSMLHLWTAQTDAVLIVRYLCACPMTPSLIIFLAVRTPLKKFITWPAIKVTLWATHASTISTQS